MYIPAKAKTGIQLAVLLFVTALASSEMKAAELVTNGGFETGSLSGWIVVNPVGVWYPWQVGGANHAGDGGYNPPVPTSPAVGSFSAWEGVAVFNTGGGSFTMTQDVTIPAASTAFLRWRDRFQSNLSSFCTGSNCGVHTYRVDILNTSNVVLQNLFISTNGVGQNKNTGWHLRGTSLNAYAGQTVRLRFLTSATVSGDGPGQIDIDDVSITSPAVPTAAYVSVGGRAVTPFGMGIPRAIVSLTDSNGNTLSCMTNGLGYYQFDKILTGETYVASIEDKRYAFADATRVVTVNDLVSDLNFTSLY